MPRACAHFVVLVLLVGLFLMRESQREPLARVDEAFADLLGRNSTKDQKSAPLTLVAIDESCLKDHPLPWTPLDFALFLQSANNFKPAAVAIDEILDWENVAAKQGGRSKIPQYRKILRESLLKTPKILLASQLGIPEDAQTIPPLEEVPLIHSVAGSAAQIPEFTAIHAQAEEELRLSASTGFINVSAGPQHSVPLLWRYRGQVVPSFVLQAVIMWEQVTANEVSVQIGSAIKVGPHLSIPINQRGEMRVNFAVARTRISFEDLVLASAQVDSKIPVTVPREYLDGRLLLLARTDPGAKSLSLATGLPGSSGELFAAGIATIQNRAFIQRVSHWFDAVLIAVTALAGFFAPRWSRGAVVFWAAVSLVAYTMAALSLFEATHVWLPLVLPAGLAAFMACYRQISPEPAPLPEPK